jgi:membrane peptidoglycan carboxypeptidase
MFGVVNEQAGTAYHAAHLEGIEFCGKTGSAQLISNEGKSRAGHVGHELVDNAWFVGFAPRRNPEIVVAVLVEHGVHGASAAAPVARDIIKAYYDKKSHEEKKQYTVELKHYELDNAESAKAVAAVVDGGRAEEQGIGAQPLPASGQAGVAAPHEGKKEQ